jgi:hypothetical protein
MNSVKRNRDLAFLTGIVAWLFILFYLISYIVASLQTNTALEWERLLNTIISFGTVTCVLIGVLFKKELLVLASVLLGLIFDIFSSLTSDFALLVNLIELLKDDWVFGLATAFGLASDLCLSVATIVLMVRLLSDDDPEAGHMPPLFVRLYAIFITISLVLSTVFFSTSISGIAPMTIVFVLVWSLGSVVKFLCDYFALNYIYPHDWSLVQRKTRAQKEAEKKQAELLKKGEKK